MRSGRQRQGSWDGAHPARAKPSDTPERQPELAMLRIMPNKLSVPLAMPETPCALAMMAPMAAPNEAPSMKETIVLPRQLN